MIPGLMMNGGALPALPPPGAVAPDPHHHWLCTGLPVGTHSAQASQTQRLSLYYRGSEEWDPVCVYESPIY